MSIISSSRASYQNPKPTSGLGVTKECYYRVKTPNGWLKMPEEDALSYKGKMPVQRVTRITQIEAL